MGWRITSSLGTSSSTFVTAQTLAPWLAVTTVVAKLRPLWTTSTLKSIGCSPITGRQNTPFARRATFVPTALVAATIDCAST